MIDLIMSIFGFGSVNYNLFWLIWGGEMCF